MDIESIREYCLSLNGCTESFPFDDVSLVFKVAGKMFALLPLDAETPSISLKCDPQYALELRERYTEVEPGYHFNKKHWNTVYLSDRIPDTELRTWIEHSYRCVIQKLPKCKQKELMSI